MTDIGVYISVAIIAYLLGSIPFGYLLVKLFLRQDIRSSGSGNIGATNVARSGARGLAIATLLLDAGKGFVSVMLAVYAGRELPSGTPANMQMAALAALFAIMGHVFPVWLKFRGGKGVATGVGAFIALAPAGVLVALATFLVVFALSRYVSLASIVASLAFPLAAYLLNPELRDPALLAIMVAASVLIILKHRSNIQRLRAGNESRFGAKTA